MAAVAALSAAGCGDDGSPAAAGSASSTSAAAATAAPTTTATPATTAAPATTSTAAGAQSYPGRPNTKMQAGSYEVVNFKPKFVFDVKASDALNTTDAPVGATYADVHAADYDTSHAYFGLWRPSEVFTDFAVRDPVVRNAVGKTAPVPADFVAWLRTVPVLKVSEEKTLQIAGRTAHRVSVTSAPLASGAGGCSPPALCHTIFIVAPGIYFATDPGSTEVLTVIDMPDGAPLVFSVVGSDAFVARAHEILETARIG